MRPDRLRRRRLPRATTAVAEGDDYGWLMTFSDLVLQLFAFVVVCAVFGKTKPAAEPVVVAPAPPPARVTQARPPVAPVRATRIAEAPPAPPSPRVETAPMQPPTPAEVPRNTMRAAAERLQALAGAQARPDALRVSAADEAVVLALQDAIGFASASADLLPAAAPILAEVRRLAAEMPDVAIEVVGHTDDIPMESAIFPSNLELSLARAARVARELAADDPQLAGRVSASGQGPYRPIASNADPEGRARNRRVEIRLVPRHG